MKTKVRNSQASDNPMQTEGSSARSEIDMDELPDAGRRRSNAVADFEAWGAEAHKHATPAAGELTDEAVTRLVHESR